MTTQPVDHQIEHAGLSAYSADPPVCRLRMVSRIPRARGYASSTADVGATFYAPTEADRVSVPAGLGLPRAPVRAGRTIGQYLVQGPLHLRPSVRPLRTVSAQAYCQRQDQIWSSVTGSLDRLRKEYELIMVEGAGSRVELYPKERYRQQDLARSIQDLAAHGTAVVGICGGCQMLGRTIRDPGHVEARVDETAGLAPLPTETTFESQKETHRVKAHITADAGWLSGVSPRQLGGYEIHMGRTHRGQTWLEITKRGKMKISVTGGAVSSNARIWGCCLHNLFNNGAFRRAWLALFGWIHSQLLCTSSMTPRRSLNV